MRKRILLAIKNGWYSPVFEHTKGHAFFKRIMTVYNILEIFECDKTCTIALYGKNSMNWIAIYIACLLKGVRLLVIHPNISRIEVAHITLLTNTNHIFIDEDLINENLVRNLFLNTMISTTNLAVLFERNDRTYHKVLAEIIVSSEQSNHTGLEVLDTLFDEDEIFSSVITATSGTENGSPNWVESNTFSIAALISKSMGLLPYSDGDKVYSKVEFAESHYLTVLLPFITECVFVGDLEHANVVIEDTISMENVWKQNVTNLYSKPFLSFLFTLSWTKVFFKKLALLALKRYYGSKLKSLVIYNSVMNEEILTTLIGKLPIYTTYGSQETNQLVAINDYSTKELCKPNAVGFPLPGIYANTFDNELELCSSSLFDKYVGDDNYTSEIRWKDNYKTGDVGFVDSNTNVMFVHGRLSAMYHNDFKLPIQLDRLERIIKSIPYVKEVILYAHNEQGKKKLILFVYPDINFVETKGLGYLKIKELMRVYLSKINLELNNSVNIDGLRVVDTPFVKTHDGKICRYYFK